MLWKSIAGALNYFLRRVFIFFLSFFHKFRSRPSKKKKKEAAEGVLALDQDEFENEEAALEAALAVPDPDAPAADSAEATAPKKPKRWENLNNFHNIRINFFSWLVWDRNSVSITVSAESIGMGADFFFSSFTHFFIILGGIQVFVSLKINLVLQK